MFKKDEDLIITLKLIEKDGNLIHLKASGYSYFEISKLIEWTINQKYAKMKNGRLELSEAGERQLLGLTKNKKMWIMPQLEFKIEKIGMYDIYIPKE